MVPATGALNFASIIYASVVVLLWLGIIALARLAFRRSNCEERIRELREQLREERRRVREELMDCRRHYEELLKEAGLRNVMALALWNAYKSGELARCYEKHGTLRVLADGSVICWLGEAERSYTIPVEPREGPSSPEPDYEIVNDEEGEEDGGAA